MIPRHKPLCDFWSDPEINYAIAKSITQFEYWREKIYSRNHLESQVKSLPVRNLPRDKISKRRFNRER